MREEKTPPDHLGLPLIQTAQAVAGADRGPLGGLAGSDRQIR